MKYESGGGLRASAADSAIFTNLSEASEDAIFMKSARLRLFGATIVMQKPLYFIAIDYHFNEYHFPASWVPWEETIQPAMGHPKMESEKSRLTIKSLGS